MYVFRWVERPFVEKGQAWWVPAIAGAGLVALALLLIVAPWLLSFVVATFTLSAGFSLLHLAWIRHDLELSTGPRSGNGKRRRTERFFEW